MSYEEVALLVGVVAAGAAVAHLYVAYRAHQIGQEAVALLRRILLGR